jgi:hypothetical protein
MIRVYSVYASGASAIAVPGCPEFALWGASMENPRMALIVRAWRSESVTGRTLVVPTAVAVLQWRSR